MKPGWLILVALVGVGCQKPPPEPVFSAPTTAPLYREAAIDASSTVKQEAELSGVQATWALERPAGSLAVLEGQAALARTIRPDVPGRYQVTLTLSREKQKTAKSHVLTVDSLLGLPVYLGQPWKDAQAAVAGAKCVVKDVDPLVTAAACRPETPGVKRPWNSFLMRSVSRGRVVSIWVASEDHNCGDITRVLGAELEGVGFKKVRTEEGQVGVQAWFQNDAGFDADMTCCPQGFCDTSIELSVQGVSSRPTGTCPSLRDAPSGVRVLANMSFMELMKVAAGTGDVVDPGIECNHAGWAVGPAGLANVTYADRQFTNTRLAFRQVGKRAPDAAPEWLLLQVANGLKSVPTPGDTALPLARSTWDEVLRAFSNRENLQALWVAASSEGKPSKPRASRP